MGVEKPQGQIHDSYNRIMACIEPGQFNSCEALHERPSRTGHDSAASDIDNRGSARCKAITRTPSLDTAIWVNITDPIDGPSFAPSPLKPLPLFMQQRTFQPEVASLAANNISSDYFTTGSSVLPMCVSAGHSKVQSSQTLSHDKGPTTPLCFKRSRTLVREEDLQRPSAHLRRHSDRCSSSYLTPPEYPEDNEAPRHQVELAAQAEESVVSQPASQSHRLTHLAPSMCLTTTSSLRQPAPRPLCQGETVSRLAASFIAQDGGGRPALRDTRRMQSVGAELRKFFTR
jgi:hypothetical protein